MAENNFVRCLPPILREEGGNDDDPHDHGGRTSRGIIQREYNAYRKRKGLPVRDVWSASADEIREIYHDQYWMPWCEKLPLGVDLVYFDFAVNAGPGQAAKAMQRALGIVVDGRMGIATVQAATEADAGALVKRFSDRRRAFYRSLSQFSRYGRGWMSRTARIERLAAGMAAGAAHVALAPIDNAEMSAVRADASDINEGPISPEKGTAVTVASAAGSGGLETIIDQTKDQITPIADISRYLQMVLIALVFVGLGLTVWGLWKRNKAKQVT